MIQRVRQKAEEILTNIFAQDSAKDINRSTVKTALRTYCATLLAEAIKKDWRINVHLLALCSILRKECA